MELRSEALSFSEADVSTVEVINTDSHPAACGALSWWSRPSVRAAFSKDFKNRNREFRLGIAKFQDWNEIASKEFKII